MQDLTLPDLGEGLPDADLVQWLVAEGDVVTLNQTLAEVETAKAVVELPSPHAGRIVRLHAQAGDTVDVGSVIVTFDLQNSGMDAGGPDASEPDASPAAVPFLRHPFLSRPSPRHPVLSLCSRPTPLPRRRPLFLRARRAGVRARGSRSRPASRSSSRSRSARPR
jgi:2-oxoisovalerate dehydrogenase E2 component (dihydrolipoyl transacylase)